MLLQIAVDDVKLLFHASISLWCDVWQAKPRGGAVTSGSLAIATLKIKCLLPSLSSATLISELPEILQQPSPQAKKHCCRQFFDLKHIALCHTHHVW